MNMSFILIATLIGAVCIIGYLLRVFTKKQWGVPKNISKPLNDHNALKILIIESDPLNQKTIQFILKQASCDSDMIRNGKDAVKMLNHYSYDAVLIDMHDATAYDIVTQITSLRSGKYLPIIALIDTVTQNCHDQCERVGVNYILTKPIDPKSLLDLITTEIKENRLNQKQLVHAEKSAVGLAELETFVGDAVIDGNQRERCEELILQLAKDVNQKDITSIYRHIVTIIKYAEQLEIDSVIDIGKEILKESEYSNVKNLVRDLEREWMSCRPFELELW